jgi:hypothetical protein
MAQNVKKIDISRVRLLALDDRLFRTEEQCRGILDLILCHAPCCEKIIFCYCAQADPSSHVSLDDADFYPLEDTYPLPNRKFLCVPCIAGQTPKWEQLCRWVHCIWAHHLRQLGESAVARTPSLVGVAVEPGHWEKPKAKRTLLSLVPPQ